MPTGFEADVTPQYTVDALCSLGTDHIYRCTAIFPLVKAGISSKSDQCALNASMQTASCLFMCLGGGQLFHNVQSLIFCIPVGIRTAHFTTSSPKVCMEASQNVSMFLRHSSSLLLHHLMPCLGVLPGTLCSAGTASQANLPFVAANFCWARHRPESFFIRTFWPDTSPRIGPPILQ